MAQKPKIQYVGMFYVHGSEARKLQEEQRRQEAKADLPLNRLRNMKPITVDPVAIVGMAVAAVMLVVLVVGALQINQDWKDYQEMSEYVSELNRTNARKAREYRESINLEEVREEALSQGLIPIEKAPVRTVSFQIPERAPEPTRLDHLVEFLTGLFEE